MYKYTTTVGTTESYACGESVRRIYSFWSMPQFSTNQEAHASIGGSSSPTHRNRGYSFCRVSTGVEHKSRTRADRADLPTNKKPRMTQAGASSIFANLLLKYTFPIAESHLSTVALFHMQLLRRDCHGYKAYDVSIVVNDISFTIIIKYLIATSTINIIK